MNANRFRAWFASRPGRPLILAHRGDSYRGPENTLEAARLGHESGADGWELDVHLTRDGIPVVLHDESLLRTTDVALRYEGDPRSASGFLVGEFTLAEVRSLDAGSWFVDPEGGPRSAAGFGSEGRISEDVRRNYSSGRIRIPTLAEALEWTVGLDWMVNVEIKPTTDDFETLVRAVLDTIRDSGATDLSTVSSFDHDVVVSVAGLEPRVATGALISGPIPDRPGEWLARIGADAIHAPVAPFPEGIPAEVPVLVYTVNDAGPSGNAARLAGMGVSGLFTDDPASFRDRPGLNPS